MSMLFGTSGIRQQSRDTFTGKCATGRVGSDPVQSNSIGTL